MFDTEFGIQNLSNFIKTISLNDKQTIKFDENFVIISSDDKKFKIKYRFHQKDKYETIISKNDRIKLIMDKINENIEFNNYLKFTINSNDLKKMRTVSTMFVESSKDVLVNIIQDDIDNISLYIKGENVCSIKKELVNPNNLFVPSVNVRLKCILDGEWDCYLFNDVLKLNANEADILKKDSIPPNFMYLVDKKQSLELLVMYSSINKAN